MKTKYHWDATDIECGMIVCRAHRGRGKWKPCGWTAKWTHMIGYVPGDGNTTKGADGRFHTNHYCHIAITDGMVYWREMSKAEMAAKMTEADMIPMPRSWWLQTVRLLRGKNP